MANIGTTWNELYIPPGQTSGICATESGVILSVRTAGNIERSADAGATWGTVASGVSTTLNAVAEDAGTFIAVGASDRILRSTDAGATWSSVRAETSGKTLYGVVALGAGVWLVVGGDGGNNGIVYKSTDDGATWSPKTLSDMDEFNGPLSLYSVALTPNGTVIAGGHFGRFARSTDAGESWETPWYESPLDAVWRFAHSDTSTVAISATGSKALRSTDNGATWSTITAFDGGTTSRSVGYAAGAYVALLFAAYRVSFDDGATWSEEQLLDYTGLQAATTENVIYGSGLTIFSSEGTPPEIFEELVSGALVISGDVFSVPVFADVADGALTINGSITGTQVFPEEVSGAIIVSGGASSTMIFVEQVNGSITVSGDISALATFFEQVRGAITAGGSIKVVEAVLTAWCVNAETSGSTRYENFNFNSFAKIGSSYYGCKADGIYALDGDDDAGAPIQAMVSFGKQDFGTTALKRVTNLYLGASSTGKLYVKVLSEGEEYLYAARDYAEHIQAQRVDLGRGLRANYLEFELYNADGDDFELASVEFVAVPLTRRI